MVVCSSFSVVLGCNYVQFVCFAPVKRLTGKIIPEMTHSELMRDVNPFSTHVKPISLLHWTAMIWSPVVVLQIGRFLTYRGQVPTWQLMLARMLSWCAMLPRDHRQQLSGPDLVALFYRLDRKRNWLVRIFCYVLLQFISTKCCLNCCIRLSYLSFLYF